MEGQGNITYGDESSNGSGGLVAANDGLSVTGTTVKLGQAVGAAGDPAALTENREIPNNGHIIFIGRDNGIDNVIGLDTDGGYSITNDTGEWESYQAGVGGHTTDFRMFTDDGVEILQEFGGGVGVIAWNSGFPNNRQDFNFNRPVLVSGFGGGSTPIAFTGAPYVVADTDFFIIADSTGGALTLNLDRTVLANHQFDVKKISSDLNTITLQPLAGTIQSLGAPAANYVFDGQGESNTVYCDGTNFYIK